MAKLKNCGQENIVTLPLYQGRVARLWESLAFDLKPEKQSDAILVSVYPKQKLGPYTKIPYCGYLYRIFRLDDKRIFFSISERLGFQNEIWFKAMSKSIVTQSNWPSRKNSLSLISKSINYLHVWDVMLKSQSSEKCKELPVNISQCLLKSVNPNLTWNFYDFIISYRWIVSYCLNKLHYDYPFHCWRMLRLFPFPNCCE